MAQTCTLTLYLFLLLSFCGSIFALLQLARNFNLILTGDDQLDHTHYFGNEESESECACAFECD